MSNAFIGEIRAFPYYFCPYGWLLCNGQDLLIQQFQMLYAVIGTRYGENGSQRFRLPDLQAATLLGSGSVNPHEHYELGYKYGTKEVTLSYGTLPPHTHNFIGKGGSSPSRTNAPSEDGDSFLSNVSYQKGLYSGTLGARAYRDVSTAPVTLHPQTVTYSAGNATVPHENHSPFLNIQYYICACDDEGSWPPHWP